MGAAEKKTEGADNQNASSMIVTMTQAQLRELVSSAVRDALGKVSDEPEYMTMEQVTELMQVHERTVRSWIADNGLPALRAGREFRFRRASVLEWLNTRASKPGSHVSKHMDRAKRLK